MPRAGSVLTAPVDYIKAAGNKAENVAIKTIDTTSLNQAVQLFNVDKGRNPKDLNELVEQKYIPQIPPAPLWHEAGLRRQFRQSNGRESSSDGHERGH